MAYFNEFPHTRTYDSDLGWLIKTVNQINEEMQSFVDFQNTIGTEFNEMLSEFSTLEAKVDRWQVELDGFQQNIQAQIDAQNLRVDTEFLQIKADIATQLSSQLADFTVQLQALRSYTDAELMLNKAYVDAVIDQFISSIPDLTTIQLYNPIRQRQTDIQTVVNDLYDAIVRVDALTCAEYDSARLTASAYDALNLDAWTFDTESGRYIEGENADNPFYMFSPFTGLWTSIKGVINELAAFHLNGVTAEAFDALGLTAAVYDAKMITAYDYDAHGVTA